MVIKLLAHSYCFLHSGHCYMRHSCAILQLRKLRPHGSHGSLASESWIWLFDPTTLSMGTSHYRVTLPLGDPGPCLGTPVVVMTGGAPGTE